MKCVEKALYFFYSWGSGDADKFLDAANHLANRYTVITYDHRGHSRSNMINSTEDYRVETHSNDAHLLLAEQTDKPAYVVGSSSGAVIGLDLSMHYPQQVRTLIPHEPVLLQLLCGDEKVQTKQFMENLKKDLRLEIIKLSSSLDRESDDQSHQIKDEHTKRMIKNLEYFITCEIRGIV